MVSNLILDTLTIFSISIIFTRERWFKEHITLNFNLTKLMLLIPKQHFYFFLDLNLSIHNDTVLQLYMINGMILILLIFRGRSPRLPSYGVFMYILTYSLFQSIFDFKSRNKFLTAKLFKQGYRYNKLSKVFSKLYRRHFEFIKK